MTAALSAAAAADPLAVLREYRALAPWGLRDLTALAAAVLDASAVVPVSPVARSQPTERTVRFYVARGLVSPPEGRGTAATYGYRHFLQVLAIKLRQMEGATLETIARELAATTGDAVERRVAATLGHRLPRPAELQLAGRDAARGRVAQALQERRPSSADAGEIRSTRCRRIGVAPGFDVLIDEDHPVLRGPQAEARLIERLRGAVASLLSPH